MLMNLNAGAFRLFFYNSSKVLRHGSFFVILTLFYKCPGDPPESIEIVSFIFVFDESEVL